MNKNQQDKNLILKKRQGVSLVIVTFGIFALMGLAALTVDAGMVLNAQAELQKATETSALVAVSSLEPQKTSGIIKIDDTKTETIARQVFSYAANKILDVPEVESVEINALSKAVHITTTAFSRTYFLQFLGIHTIKLNAQAAAIIAPEYLSSSTDANSIIVGSGTDDNDIRQPLGDNKNSSLDSSGNVKSQNLYGPPDNKAVSLGAGGYFTIRLNTPVIDLTGADLYIKELGNLEGYFVFAGVDNNPDNPYINASNPGDGIKWINISCTGTPAGNDSSGSVGAYYVNVEHKNKSSTNEAKFYGSGYFDLGASCTKSLSQTYGSSSEKISSAKYLKIIDDNSEDGFMTDNPNVPALIAGEHSSVTPGADIDAVSVLHHSRLINSSDFSIDTDGDGLIDVVELFIQTSPTKVDYDGDGINDALEYSGWWNDSGVKKSIINSGSATVFFTNPAESDNDGSNNIIFK